MAVFLRVERKAQALDQEQNIEPRHKSMYGQLTIDKGAKSTQWGRDKLFNVSAYKGVKLDHYLTLLIK